MTKTTLASLALLALAGCSSTMTYQLYQPAAFVEDGWYVFDTFRYAGTLHNGQPNGRGRLVYKNGVEVTGRFEDGVLEGDDATIRVPGRGVYRGRARGGTLVGGEVRYADGTFFRGALSGFRQDGRGVLVTQDGRVYTGTIRDGKLDGSGSLYSPSDGTTTYGTFEEGRLDGEVLVRDERTGREEARVLRDGRDVTEQHLERRAREQVERSERSERQRLDRELERRRGAAEEAERTYRRELRRVESETSDMEDRCYCEFNICLTSRNPTHHPYTRTYRGQEWTTYAAHDAPESRIMGQIRRKADTKLACRAWARDPDNFDASRLDQIDQEFGRAMRQAQREREQAERERRQALRRQEQQRQRRIREQREAEERRLKERARQQAEELERRCAANSNACGCWTPEQLRACALDDGPGACACNW